MCVARVMKFSLVLSAVFLLFADGPTWAVTQCTCPRVQASGVGNTSCSASESNGKCTVDFNIFFERENRAVDLLKRAGISSIHVPDPRNNAVIGLANMRGRRDEFVDAILIYLTVALSAQSNANDLVPTVRQIIDAVRSSSMADRILQAFDPSGAGFLQPDRTNPVIENFPSRIRGRMVPGCMELFVDNAWVMFKTNWSPFSNAPRCGR